jgi:hypothetical protein
MVAALALAPSMASAADVIIRDNGAEVVDQPSGVVIERRVPPPPVVEEDDSTTGAAPQGDNCRYTTVHKEDADGRTTTIRKKECD